ncbi:hypothetical protein AB1Y20_012573 [Prymnesium parvum]|uniref:Uncharacterized protein n=1 Tax=Prymnesium parvum TaxID=97485 RepID=A0AB34IIW0_PRYPA
MAADDAALMHCLALLHEKADEQRFVGLLLAARLVTLPSHLPLLFDAAIPFVRRLLLSPPPDDPSLPNPYRTLALTLLASFATDAGLHARPEFLACAAAAAAPFAGGRGTGAAEVSESAAVLRAVLAQPEGLAEAVRARLASSVLARAAKTGKIEAEAARAELLAAATVLARALGACRDARTFELLHALLSLLRAARRGEALPPASAAPLGKALFEGLAPLLGSRLPAAARSETLQAVAAGLHLCGPHWLVGNSPSLHADSPDAPDGAAGRLVALVVQLSSVELQMALYDQPGPTSAACEAALPACCQLLEEALFRLHADAEGEGEGGAGGEAWLEAMSDAQLISSNRAFHSAVKAALDYAEALRAEVAAIRQEDAPSAAHESEGMAHPLLLPIARFLSAWMAQPSAPDATQLYDRAISLLPFLRDATASVAAEAWVDHLRTHGRVPSNAEESARVPPATPVSDETMADLFTRLMPHDPEAQAAMAQWAQSNAAANGAGPS